MNERNKKQPIRVLIADYGKVYPGLSKECLELQGDLVIETAFTKLDVVEKINRFNPQVVVLDIAPYTLFFKETIRALKNQRNQVAVIVFAINVKEQLSEYPAKIVDCAVEKFGDPAAVYAELKSCIEKIAGFRVKQDFQIA